MMVCDNIFRWTGIYASVGQSCSVIQYNYAGNNDVPQINFGNGICNVADQSRTMETACSSVPMPLTDRKSRLCYCAQAGKPSPLFLSRNMILGGKFVQRVAVYKNLC